MSDQSSAEGDCNKAIKIKASPEAYVLRSKLQEKAGQLERAVRDLSEALRLHPRHAGATAELTRILEADKSIDANPRAGDAYSLRGAARQALGQLDGALQDFDKAIELDARNGRLYFSRGIIHEARRDKKRAYADFDKAVELDPQSANAYARRGMLAAYRSAIRQSHAGFDDGPADQSGQAGCY